LASKEIQQIIFERDDFTCQGCKKKGRPYWEVDVSAALASRTIFLVADHKDGRSEELSNLQALCWSCNSSKSGRNQYAFKMSVALKQLGRPVVFYPSLKNIFGFKASLLLCDLIYWPPRGRHERAASGWIYKSAEELLEETGLSYKEQYRARKVLTNAGVLEEDYRREEHLLFLRVNPMKLDALWDSLGTGQNGMCPIPNEEVPLDNLEGGTGQKVSSNKTKSTTESTHTEWRAIIISAIEESQRTGEPADDILKRKRA